MIDLSQVTEFTVLPSTDEEFQPPGYHEPGWLMFEVLSVDCSKSPIYRLETEVIDYDCDSSVFWVNEGVGFECWINQYVDLDQPGVFVIEGITGRYIRGDGWTTDDDEEWDFKLCRYATTAEFAAGTCVWRLA